MDLTGAEWRKASRSGSNGMNCVEVAAVWHKSTRSASNGGDCVEAASVDRKVAVRDSKNPDGPKLGFTREEWASFVAGLKDGRFDR